MRGIFLLAIAFGFVSTLCAQNLPQPQTEQQRDLTTVKENSAATNPVPTKTAAPPIIPHSYALVVGIARYAHLPVKAQLRFADRDAEDIYTTLISAQGGNFPAENVHKLINEEASLANLRHELEQWLPSVTTPEDRVLVYFAGHGFIAGGKAYLAPNDVDISHLSGTAYPMEDLGRAISTKIHGKWKVLITDACHSGAITPEDDTAQVNHSLLDLNNSSFSLTASRDREQSFESPQWGGGHGIFTYYVIQGLQGEADTTGDGIVTADELADYVRTNVRLATKTPRIPPQIVAASTPTWCWPTIPVHVQIARTELPRRTTYGTLIFQTNMDDVEVWLDGKSLGVIDKTKPQRFPGITPGPHTIKGVHLDMSLTARAKSRFIRDKRRQSTSAL